MLMRETKLWMAWLLYSGPAEHSRRSDGFVMLIHGLALEMGQQRFPNLAGNRLALHI